MFLMSSCRAWLLGLLVLLVGCAAPQPSFVNLPKDYFASGKGSIGVASTTLPVPDTYFPGAHCLLCLATASMANNAMTTAVRQWPTDDLKGLKEEVAVLLRAQGQTVVVIDEPIKVADFPARNAPQEGFALKDFSTVKASSKIDRLLVIEYRTLGAVRNYSAYVPTGAPRATFEAHAYIVNLNTHKFELYDMISRDNGVQGNWDEAPKFPGLTNAYFTSIEEGKDAIKKPFLK